MIKVKDGYAKLIGTTYSGSADRVLLSNGGDKAVSDFAAASGVVTALGTSGNYVTWTKNGTANNLTVPFATTASRLGLNGIADATTYGSYAGIIQSSSGGPESGSWHSSLKILHNNAEGYYTQLAQNFTGSHGLWHRSNRSGTISRWYRVIDDGMLTSRYRTTSSTSKIKIAINSTKRWMLAFNVRVYQGYKYYDIRFSGYNYGSNYWYTPKASLVDGDASITVYFGYDAVDKLWVAIDGGSYTGVEISNVTNGYNDHELGENIAGLFTISNVESLSGTTQSTQTLSQLADALTVVSKGSATNPIYWDANGKPIACTYSLNATVPSGALFTDTKNTAGSTDTSSKIFLIGATSQAANPQTYSHDTAYVGTDGYLYSNKEKVDMRLTTSLVPLGTAIPKNANLNTTEYLKVGKYYCSANATAVTLVNCPTEYAFMMEVYSPLSTTIDNETTSAYVYRLRKITHYNTGVQYIQYVGSGATAGSFTYNSWYVVPRTAFTLDTTDNNGGSAARGSATQGVYVDSTGTLQAMTYTLGKSVPSDAVFTDNNYYHTRAYSSGLKISTGTGVSDMYVPNATSSQAGVVSTAAQTWAGVKTFSNKIVAQSGVTIGSTDDIGWYPYGGRICAGLTAAQGVNVGSLLISNAWADASKVPTNGLYCKGNSIFGGSLEVFSTGSSWSEGIRIHPASNGWSGIVLCESSNSGATATSAKTWSMHNNEGTFGFYKNGSNTSATQYLSNVSNAWYMKGDLNMSGNVKLTGHELHLKTSGTSSNDSGDIVFYYGNGKEKARIWTSDTYTAASGPYFRVYKEDGTLLANTTLALATHTHTKLNNYYSSRPTSIDPGVIGDGSMFHFKCTSSVTDTTTDPGDAHILHFNWDNTGGYDFQIAGLTSNSVMKIRGMNGGTWQPWATVLTNNNYTSYISNTNYYHTRVYSSGLKISTGTGVSDMYVPTGTTSTLGVVKQHTASDCTSYTSDEGATTPAAVKKAVGMFGVLSGYGTCSTAAATAAKVVSIADTNWKLVTGCIIGVKFTNTNSASSVTLNVNSTGAKSIWYNNAAYTSTSSSICGYANRVTYYMYDGTYWVWLNMGSLDGNTDTKVRQYITDTTNTSYPILFRYDIAAVSSGSYTTNYSRFDSGITINPSTNTITATKFDGTATIAEKLKASDNTITTTANDTTAKWGALHNTVHFYSSTGQLTDQPGQYGLLLNFNKSSEVHQFWLTQASGDVYHRGGNSSGWSGTWRKLLDSSNYTSYVNTTNFPGLNKTGTVTSVTVTGSNGLSGTGTVTTSGTITLSNSGVRSTTINGNYLRVNTNGTNADLTIPYATSAGSATSATSAGYLTVQDVRNATRSPNYFTGRVVTAWFNNTGTPNSDWWSGIHVKGWTSGYASWELCSYSSQGTANDYRLYHRNGINDAWGNWKTIAYTSDILLSGVSFTSGDKDNGEHNCNNITSNGHWYYTSNGPSGLGEQSTDGALYSQAYNTSWVAQIAQDYRNGNLFTRGRNNGTWQSWRAVAYKDDTPWSGAPTSISDFNTFAKSNRSYIGSLCLTNGTWYNFISCRHRNGSGDGNAYGLYFYSTLTTNGHLYWNKECNGTWQGARVILDSVNYTSYFTDTKVKVTSSTSTFYITGTTTSPTSSGTTGALVAYSSVNVQSGTKVYASGGFFQSSDEILKDILKPVTVNLDEIKNLRKVYYTWKAKPEDGIQLGVIAQDIQKLYPEIVNKDAETGYLSVAYDKLSVITLVAIDELYTMIKTLRDENEQLKSMLNK